MARYEYRVGSSNKFWEITVEGDTYTVVYGRIGTAGQTSVKSFKDAATAQKKADSAANSKVKKGYVRIEAAQEEAQDAAVQELLVHADALTEAGDPRGALISVMAKMEESSGAERKTLASEAQSLRSANQEAFEGPRMDDGKRACSRVEWKLGYWDRLTVWSHGDHPEVVTQDLVAELLAHPSAARLTYLKLGIPHTVWDGESNWQPVLDVLARIGAPHLEVLEVADDDDNAEISWCVIGNLGGVWKVAPKLQSVRIQGVAVALGEIDAPNLKRLEIVSGGLPSEPVKQLGKASLPSLTHLEVYLGTDDYGANTTIEDCAGILAGKGLPALKYLGLKNGEIMDDLARVAPKGAIVPQLEVLDLSMGTMTDDGAKALTEHAAALQHLKTLDISDNFVLAPAAAALKLAVPSAATHGQKDPFEDGDDEPWYYTSVAE